jgi:hypothetical protein
MSLQAPNLAIVFGSLAPPQADVTELTLHLGCTSEVSSFEVVLQNFEGKYSSTGAAPLQVGSDGSISLGRGTTCPMLITCRVEKIQYESTPVEHYVRVSGRCWGERLFRRVVTKTYTNAKGEDIIKDLLDYYAGLSHIRGGTELVQATDTTYSSLTYQDTPAFDILKYIAETADKQGVIGYDFRVAPDGKFEFFPKNTQPAAVSLAERLEVSQYNKDVSRIRNKIRVYGAADKSVPADKDAWTESLAPTGGVWTAVAGIVSLDMDIKAKGGCSVRTYAESLSYAAAIFTFNPESLVDAEAYPTLNLWLNRDASFNGNVSIRLFDGTGKIASHQLTVGASQWFQVQLGVGSQAVDQWQLDAGFDWSRIWRVQVACWFDEVSTGSFWVDGLFFGGKRYSALQEDAPSQVTFGLREQVEVNEELWSDLECLGRAAALLANLKSPAESVTLKSSVLDFGAVPILAGDTLHVELPIEGVDCDFRVDSVEYHVDGVSQELEVGLELGREAPLLADYVYALRAKMESLSRYKVAK